MTYLDQKLPKILDKKDIFVGYNIYKEKCLLYRINSLYYYDMEKKEIFHRGQIYDKSLISYHKIVEKNKRIKKRNIVKDYRKDLKIIPSKNIDMNNLVLGGEIKIKRIDKKTRMAYCNSNRLLYKVDNKGKIEYIDLLTNNKYKEAKNGLYKSEEKGYIRPEKLRSYLPEEYKLKELKRTRKEIVEDYINNYGIYSYICAETKQKKIVKK